MPTHVLQSLVLAATLALGGGTAHAASETAMFDFYVAGIKAGEMSLAMSEDDRGAYTARSNIDAAGLVGAFLTFFYHGQSAGKVDSAGKVVPQRFDATSKTLGAERRTKIDWKNGAPANVSVVPPRKNMPDPAEQAGTLDPISAGFVILRDAPPEQLCDRTIMVYDGSRLSRLTLGDRVPADGGFTCVGSYARIKGAAHTLSSQREFPFDLVFATGTDGIAQLRRIETSTSFGRAVLERRS